MKKFIYIALLVLIVSCGASENKYSQACKQLGVECKNEDEFNRIVRREVRNSLLKNVNEIAISVEHFNKKISLYTKKSFSVDMVQYKLTSTDVRTIADRVISSTEKIDDTKIFVPKVVYNPSDKNTLQILDMRHGVEIKDATVKSQFSEYQKLCLTYPAGFCRLSLIGRVTAVKGEEGWKGWIIVEDFNGELLSVDRFNDLLVEQITRDVRQLHRSSDSKFDKDTIHKLTKDRLTSFSN